MGYVFSKMYAWVYGQDEVKVIIVGLDNAGKTTTLYKLCVPTNATPAAGLQTRTLRTDPAARLPLLPLLVPTAVC